MQYYPSTDLTNYLRYEDGLRVLDLTGTGLFRAPDAVTELSKIEKLIEKLVLDENNLIALPAGINKLKNLILLNLKNNKLTELPAEIGDLRELRWLFLSKNQLVGLPTSIQRLTKLKKLDLDENKLTELPAEIGDLRALSQLSVGPNPLTVDAIRRALKLRKKGVSVSGVAGKPGGYCSYLEVRKKPR